MIAKELENPFTNLEHDHASCVVEALNAAKTACKKNGERLTPLRLKVLRRSLPCPDRLTWTLRTLRPLWLTLVLP